MFQRVKQLCKRYSNLYIRTLFDGLAQDYRNSIANALELL